MIQAVETCDVCGKESRFEIQYGRRGAHIKDAFVALDFNVGDQYKSKDDIYDVELDTVCKPCRVALLTAVRDTIAARKKKGRK